MSRLVDVDSDEFWQILFDEACIEGKQAERISNELNKIVAYDIDDVIGAIQRLPHGTELNVELENELIGIVKAGFKKTQENTLENTLDEVEL